MDDDESDQIVSSYSDGTVALHDVSCAPSANEDSTPYNFSIKETQRWNAHTMFGCPSEVWTCSFLRGNAHVVMSGADDCSLKIWDIRQTQRPTHKIGNSEFESGVTAISAHPALSHIFAAGSYDEYVRIYDHRKVDEPMTKFRVGGGVWRIKWHPSAHNHGKMLVAAMHGGCRVVNIPTLDTQSGTGADDVEILSKFTAHESMAYGADWICYGQSLASCEAAASCSFYDRQAFIWNPYSSSRLNKTYVI
jgi:diphthamide biosynthesis protein 7